MITDFFRSFVVGLIFWGILAGAWCVRANELPERPRGRTLHTPLGAEECFTTDELKKIVAWVETAEHLYKVNEDLQALNETYRAEITVLGQENALHENQVRSLLIEVDRLKELIDLQQKDCKKVGRQDKIRLALTWGAIGLLLGTTTAFAVAYGVKD